MISQKDNKPVIRLLQHLSCSGGTIISRCLAAMPEVALLSEVNPHSRIHLKHLRFSPTDMTYLSILGGFPESDELSRKIFLAEIRVIQKHVRKHHKKLVIRDHSHSDYLVDPVNTAMGTTRRLLAQDYQLRTIINLRHPVDSYLSMQLRGWVKFTPPTFDEFCRRYLLFFEKNKPNRLFKYEHFVREAESEIKAMCAALSLEYDRAFLENLDQIKLTGDSGRSSSSTIGPRKRREYDRKFEQEVLSSKHFEDICVRFDYSPDLKKQA